MAIRPSLIQSSSGLVSSNWPTPMVIGVCHSCS